MTDHNTDPVLDLSKETLLRACKGDIRKLPSFIVHDDDAWPWFNSVRPAKGKIHMRRSTFNRVVAPQVPVKPGLFVRADAQEFTIDLRVDQLEGSSDIASAAPDAKNHDTARRVAVADEAGRLPDEEDYGTQIVERSPGREVDRDDLERIARDPEKRGIGSAVFSGVRDTEPDPVGDDD
jgi:hypothetical protein